MSTEWAVQIPEKVRMSVIKLFKLVDTNSESSPKEFGECFTEDGILEAFHGPQVGREAITENRVGSWTGPINLRQTTLHRIFAMDEQGRDVAVHLTCRNGLIDGKTFVVMPQHVHLKLNGENLFSYYKAFADPNPMKLAVAKLKSESNGIQ